MEKVQVLVIDDSAFMRKMITQLLTEDPRIQVVAAARNGEDGIKKVKQYQPDVITLDVEMPVMDGITTLKHIMEHFPIPVVMISSMDATGKDATVKAMQLGAVDFIRKPSGSISLNMDQIQSEMIETVIAATHADVKKQHVEHVEPIKHTNKAKYSQSIYAIGTSTGGPRALQAVLTALPENFGAPIVIVQHMPALFTKSLAERLDSLSSIRVKEAEHGELLQDGVAYIAPGDQHLHVRQVGTSLAIELGNEPPELGHRPSVNVMLRSIAPLKRLNKVAIILTGMGKDGKEGVKAMKEKDPSSLVFVESSKTAIVNGMPHSVRQTNLVNEVIPLQSIGKAMNKSLNRKRR